MSALEVWRFQDLINESALPEFFLTLTVDYETTKVQKIVSGPFMCIDEARTEKARIEGGTDGAA